MVFGANGLCLTILESIWCAEQTCESGFLILGLGLYLWFTQIQASEGVYLMKNWPICKKFTTNLIVCTCIKHQCWYWSKIKNPASHFGLPCQMLSKMVWHNPVAPTTTEEIDYRENWWGLDTGTTSTTTSFMLTSFRPTSFRPDIF